MQLEMVFMQICIRNIFIDNDGQIVPIDFGIMGRLDKMSKRFLAEILFGFIQRDYRKVAEVHPLLVLFQSSYR